MIVLFTDAQKEVVRVEVELDGKPLRQPTFVQFRGKLYRSTGSNGSTTVFYHEIKEGFQIVESK